MKANEMLSVLFYLNGAKRTRDGLVPLYVRITIDGERKEFASGKRLSPEHWTAQERATKDCPDYLSINSYITKTAAALEKCYNVLDATETKVELQLELLPLSRDISRADLNRIFKFD